MYSTICHTLPLLQREHQRRPKPRRDTVHGRKLRRPLVDTTQPQSHPIGRVVVAGGAVHSDVDMRDAGAGIVRRRSRIFSALCPLQLSTKRRRMPFVFVAADNGPVLIRLSSALRCSDSKSSLPRVSTVAATPEPVIQERASCGLAAPLTGVPGRSAAISSPKADVRGLKDPLDRPEDDRTRP